MKPGNLRGLLWMFLSTIGFSISHLLVRFVSPEIHSFQSVFFRALFGVLVVSPWLLRYGFAPLKTSRLPLHLLRACLSVTSLACFYYALTTIPLAKATVIGFMAPILVTVLVVVVLKEQASPRAWMALLLGAAGMLVMLRPGMIHLDFGTLVMLISTMIFSCNLLVIKMLTRTESSIAITGYVALLLIPLSLPLAIPVWRWPDLEQFSWLTLMGVSNAVSLILFTQAMKEAATSVVIPLDFLRLLWIAVLAYAVFGEVPDAFTWIGGVMIFSGVLLVAAKERRS